ncbi:hypothetical protein B0H10DRAFT_212857 [Mycena sp. CBHHK59/15]|nr:hypothetical protein B0H10DRAFT_212857 [Mycena sp. CBHHK59/15]
MVCGGQVALGRRSWEWCVWDALGTASSRPIPNEDAPPGTGLGTASTAPAAVPRSRVRSDWSVRGWTRSTVCRTASKEKVPCDAHLIVDRVSTTSNAYSGHRLSQASVIRPMPTAKQGARGGPRRRNRGIHHRCGGDKYMDLGGRIPGDIGKRVVRLLCSPCLNTHVLRASSVAERVNDCARYGRLTKRGDVVCRANPGKVKSWPEVDIPNPWLRDSLLPYPLRAGPPFKHRVYRHPMKQRGGPSRLPPYQTHLTLSAVAHRGATPDIALVGLLVLEVTAVRLSIFR